MTESSRGGESAGGKRGGRMWSPIGGLMSDGRLRLDEMADGRYGLIQVIWPVGLLGGNYSFSFILV